MKIGSEKLYFGEVCNIGVLKTPLKPLLSDSCYEIKTTSEDMFYHRHDYPRLVSGLSMESNIDWRERKDKTVQSQEKRLKWVEGSGELEVWLWKTCAFVSLLQF